MTALTKSDIVGQSVETVYCEHEIGVVVILGSGIGFTLPSPYATKVDEATRPTDLSGVEDLAILGGHIVDLLRPVDLTNIDTEIQESAKLQLSTGICISLMWWAVYSQTQCI